jgi:hypothetical protein
VEHRPDGHDLGDLSAKALERVVLDPLRPSVRRVKTEGRDVVWTKRAVTGPRLHDPNGRHIAVDQHDMTRLGELLWQRRQPVTRQLCRCRKVMLFDEPGSKALRFLGDSGRAGNEERHAVTVAVVDLEQEGTMKPAHSHGERSD